MAPFRSSIRCVLFLSALVLSARAADPYAEAMADLGRVDPAALRRAVQDLERSFPRSYRLEPATRDALAVLPQRLPGIRAGLRRREPQALREGRAALALQRRVLLANPLLDFRDLLAICRKPLGDPRRATGDAANDKGLGKFLGLPQQSSWQLHTMPRTDGWDNEIVALDLRDPAARPRTLYRPPGGRLVNEMDLHWDAGRLLVSMPDERGLWQVFELDLSGGGCRQVSPADLPDVHNFDACYLPNERIVYVSTAPFQGVPCNASVNVGMSYVMDPDGTHVRQLCFEQDHNFCPTVMNDGRVLYLRWEYTDIPHVWARFLFTMNPDGTGQREFYGSGGYWPNAIFYARPIPGHPTKFVGIVTGHHVGRVGELVLFDPARGRRSTAGVVQRIPGHGRPVRALVEDKLTLDSWPKFLHPWPLSDKYFLVACKPAPDALWGIYLVDVFDNLLCLHEIEGQALLEPIPWRPIPRPPVLADRVDLARDDARIYLEDIYAGPGLAGVPRGTVKRLRLFTYQFAYHGVAGINHRVGTDGPWEPKRILGTVPVYEDGSAFFTVPANTPLSLQPLDAAGQALQLMRSWTTAMPGETVSCAGCHESQNRGPRNRRTLASRRAPSEIAPWYGPVRGFSFVREVQPVLDRHCVACHDGGDQAPAPDLRGERDAYVVYKNGDPSGALIRGVPAEELVTQYGSVFPPAYVALRGLVRVGGLESDLRLLPPGEFHADTCELVQILRKGHHGVRLDTEAWERLATWIDLNAPCHGTWREVVGDAKICRDHERRLALRRRYGGDTADYEVYPPPTLRPPVPGPVAARPAEVRSAPTVSGWPWSTARRAAFELRRRTLPLGGGQNLEFVRIPAGTFLMGDTQGEADETPAGPVTVERPFWMSTCEITNAQYAAFDPEHDSRFQDKGSWMFNEWDLGWPLNQPAQPVVRVSWERALAFCRWLSERTGAAVTLPTEAQWEWACRAGRGSAFWYGDGDTDFSACANLGDRTLRDLAYDARDYRCPDIVPRDDRWSDGALVSAAVGSYRPNPWGLHDMHGNVWEWTRSSYAPYPYRDDDGRNALEREGPRVVRGGSWYDRPQRCRAAFRLAYPRYRRVYNVGFRVMIEIPEASAEIRLAASTAPNPDREEVR